MSVETAGPPQPDVAAVSATNSVNPVDGPFIRFPPFPQPPDGVQIMSFEQFKERGIRVEPGPDEAEVDALGIPTIPLRVRHDTDQCKTNTKRKRKEEEAKAREKGGLGAKKAPWWEQWEDGEVIRFSIGFNPNSSRFERIHAAAADFTSGRSWPTQFASETGPGFIWDKFQRYIGLPAGGAVPGEKKKKAAKEVVDEEMSDDDVDEEEDEATEPAVPSGRRPGIYMDRQLQGQLKTDTNDEKLLAFFNSPEKSIKIFLTSYSRMMGYIWSDANLDCMGRVLDFFVRFLLRSKVLPEVERPLRRSLDVIATAITELPHTAAFAKVTPDSFSAACNGCWGRMSSGYTVLSLDIEETSTPDVPMAKIEEVEPEAPEANASGWGNSSSENPWGPAEGGVWGNSGAGENVWEASLITDTIQQAASWENAEQKNLLTFLGPTAFPLTHTTGIVEQSMRRIKAITPPSSNPPKSPPLPEGVTDPDADAVEVELDRQFTKVVLEPMVDWDGGESPVYARPTILESSQGAVVDPNAPEPPEGAPKAHDPFKDDITLLVENIPEQLGLMHIGMGLGGTWVQIVRQGEPVKKKKKGKSKSKKPSFWYLDELAVVTPSFWAIKS